MKNKFLLGVALTFCSTLVYAIQTAIIKHAGSQLQVPVIVFAQGIICACLILPMMYIQARGTQRQIFYTAHPIIHLFRTIFSLGISYFLFYAVKFIPLVDAVLLANTSPLLGPLLGFCFLSRRISYSMGISIIVGFIGVMLVLKPDSGVFQSASLLAFGASICMATSIILLAEAKKDTGITNAFYYFLFSIPISGIGAFFFWQPLSGQLVLLLIGIGVLFFIVQLTLIYALKYTNAQTVSSLYLSNVIFAAIISVIFWDTRLTLLSSVGIVLTLLGAILTIKAQSNTVKSISYENKTI